MKQLLFFLCLFTGMISQAQAQERVPAQKGSVYGAAFEAKKTINAGEFAGLVKDSNKVAVQVQGKVLDVCPKKGCWMNVAMQDGDTIFVKMKDYAFFVPENIKGRDIVLDGDAYVETTSVKELQHYAEDAKRPRAEIDAITQPKKKVRFTANSIKVLN